MRYLPLGLTIALAVAFGMALAPFLAPVLVVVGWLVVGLLCVLAVLFLLGQIAMTGERDERRRG